MPVFAKPVISSSGRVPAKAVGANRHSKHEEDSHDIDEDPENASPNVVRASDRLAAGRSSLEPQQARSTTRQTNRSLNAPKPSSEAKPPAASSPLTVKPVPAPDNQHQENDKLKVFVRMRPVRTSDKAPTGDQLCVQKVSSTSLRYLGDRQASTSPRGSTDKYFTFDGVMGWRATQEQVFKAVGAPLVDTALAGINACCLAYGQPGSGKSFTMEGSQLPTATGNVTRSSPRTPGTATASNSQEPQPLGGVLRGLIPRTFEKLFQDINHSEDQGRYMVYASYLSICSDRVFDLLASPSRPTLLQTEESSDEAIGDGATEELVSSAEDAMKLFQRATINRRRTITASSPASLDCHSVLTLRVKRMPPAPTPPPSASTLASAATTPEGASTFVAAAAATAAAAAAAAAGVSAGASSVTDSLLGDLCNSEGGGNETDGGRSSYLRFIEIAGRGLAHDAGGLHLLSRVLGQGVDAESLGILQQASETTSIEESNASATSGHCTNNPSPKLSQLLQDVLHGGTRTSLVATISPSAASATATHDTLRLAHLTQTLHPSTAASRALARSMPGMHSTPAVSQGNIHATECSSESFSLDCSEGSSMPSVASSASGAVSAAHSSADSTADSEVNSASTCASPHMAYLGLPPGIAPDEPPLHPPSPSNCLRELPLHPTQHDSTANSTKNILEPSGMFLGCEERDIRARKPGTLSSIVPPSGRVSTGGTPARSPLGTCAPLLATSQSLPKGGNSTYSSSTNGGCDGVSHSKFVDFIMHGLHEFPRKPPSSGMPLLPSTLALFKQPSSEASAQEASVMHASAEASQDASPSEMISIELQPSPRVFSTNKTVIPSSSMHAPMHGATEQACVAVAQLSEQSLNECMLSCTDAWDESSLREPDEVHTEVHSAVPSTAAMRLSKEDRSRSVASGVRMHERQAHMRFDSGGSVESLKAVVSTSTLSCMQPRHNARDSTKISADVPDGSGAEKECESPHEYGAPPSYDQVMAEALVDEEHYVHGGDKLNTDAAGSDPVAIPNAVNTQPSEQVLAARPAEHALEPLPMHAHASERLCHALKSKRPSAPNGEESCILAWRLIPAVSGAPSIESSRDSLARIAVCTGNGGPPLHVKLPEASTSHALLSAEASRCISPQSQDSTMDDTENHVQVCAEGYDLEPSAPSTKHANTNPVAAPHHASQESQKDQKQEELGVLIITEDDEVLDGKAIAPQPQACAVPTENKATACIAPTTVAPEKEAAVSVPLASHTCKTSQYEREGGAVHGANAAVKALAALQLKEQAAADILHDTHACLDDQDDFMMLPMPPRPSEVLSRPQQAPPLPPHVPPRPESRKVHVSHALPFVPLMVGSSDGGASSRTLTPQGGSPKGGLVPSLDCALQGALRAHSYLVEAPITEPRWQGGSYQGHGTVSAGSPLNPPTRVAVPPLNVDAVYHEASTSTATCSESYGDSYEDSYGESSSLPLAAMHSNESVSCDYSYTHGSASMSCMGSSTHGSGCTTCIAREREAIEQNVVSSAQAPVGGAYAQSRSPAKANRTDEQSMPLVTQAKPPCMHGTHAHNCKSGVGAHNAPQASPVVSHKSSDPVAKASSVVDVHDKSTAVQGQSVQGSVAKSSTQAYNAAQTCLPTTLSAPSPQVASGVMVPTIRHECAYNTALELHEASVASRIAALGREIEALDIQGRCVVQCEDSLIDSVHSLPISHGVKAYSPQSNSSYTSGSESLDPLSADQPQAAQEALPVVKQVVKSEEVQYTAEHAKMAIERAASLEAEVHRMKLDYKKEMAAAIQWATDCAAREHKAEGMQLRRHALQAYKDDMAAVKNASTQEINALKAVVLRLQNEASDKDAAREHSEAALSRDMEELCGQISTAAKAAADDRLAAEKQIAELQSLLHTARAETAQARHEANQFKAKLMEPLLCSTSSTTPSTSSLIPTSPLSDTTFPNCAPAQSSDDPKLPEASSSTADAEGPEDSTAVATQPGCVDSSVDQPVEHSDLEVVVPEQQKSLFAKFRAVIGAGKALSNAKPEDENVPENVTEEPVEQQLQNVQGKLQCVEHEQEQLQRTLQVMTEGISLQELCGLVSGPWKRAPLIDVGMLPPGVPSATAAMQLTGTPLLPTQLDASAWGLQPISADNQVYCMAGGATTLRGGTLTLPEGSVLLLQDCEDVKLQGWTISGGTVVAFGNKCKATLDNCTLRTATVAMGGATLTISNCSHSNTPVAMIAAAPNTSLTCMNSTVTDCSQASLAIGRASATLQNLEASGMFLGAAIEARGVGTNMSVTGAKICGITEMPKPGVNPKTMPKAAAVRTPTDGAVARCGAALNLHDTAIERVSIGVRATDPETVVHLTNCDVRIACMALAHASDGARMHATGTNFETTAVGGGGIVSTGQDSVVVLSQCLVSDSYSSAVTVLDSATAVLSDCVLAASQHAAGMDVCGKGSQLKARACSVRYNRGEGVRVSNAAHATLHHVTCSGNAAHGIAVLSGARLEASDITSATDGHHALFAHGTKVDLQDSKLQNAAMSAACIESYAGANLDNCVLEHSKASHGVAASGSALVTLRKCVLRRNKGNGVSLTAGAHAGFLNSQCEHNGTHGISVSDTCKLEAEGLRIISEAAHGISMNGLHASAKLVKCTVKDCAWSGVALGGGSTLEATGCEFTGARECMGVHVEGSQTSASLQYTNISRNKGSGLCVEAGASAKLVGCAGSHNGKSAFEVTGGSCMTADRCTSTADAQGGVLVDGVATNATVENTKVSRSLASGMHIQGGSTATVRACEVTGSIQSGITVQGEGTEASLNSCKLLDNKGAGTSVRDDAIASLRNCTTHANHASAIAVFKRGAAWLDKCKSSSESLNTRDTCSKLQYVIPPCNAERTALVLIKVLAVLLLVTVTGSVGVFSGALSQGVTPGVV